VTNCSSAVIRQKLAPALQAEFQENLRGYLDQLKAGSRISRFATRD
jgi:hypothetical protein